MYVNVHTSGLQVALNLMNLTDKKWVKHSDVKVPTPTRSLRVINQQLWCCHRDGITVFDQDLQQQRIMPSGKMGECHDVAQSNGDILIAAENGLHLLEETGTYATVMCYHNNT